MTHRPEHNGATVRLSEVLSALSFILDVVEGQPEGHCIRACFIGMSVAGRLGLSEEDRSALFYALLLKDAGCSSNASRVAALFDADDPVVKRELSMVDRERMSEVVPYIARNVSPDGSLLEKARRFSAVVREREEASRGLVKIRCERGAEISRLLGFPEATARAIRALDERWDGAGYPDGLKGDEVPILARISGLAQTAEVFHAAHGPDGAVETILARRGSWFDPAVVDAFLTVAREGTLWEDLRSPELSSAVSRMEPDGLTVAATPERLDLVARAFARIIDAKSPYTFQHSERVAHASGTMANHAGLPAGAARDLEWTGLLHDIGKLGVSNRILDKPGRLTQTEYARIKEHTRLTHEVLSRVSPFRHLAEVAASHHEKLDGSGYHRGLSGEDLGLPARILAVADTYDALSQDRPYRRAMTTEGVMSVLKAEAGAGRLCPECVGAAEELAARGRLP